MISRASCSSISFRSRSGTPARASFVDRITRDREIATRVRESNELVNFNLHVLYVTTSALHAVRFGDANALLNAFLPTRSSETIKARFIEASMKAVISEQSARSAFVQRIRRFVNSGKLDHELFVVVVSYLFVISGAWNDGLLGFTSSVWAEIAEGVMATVLLLEIMSRLAFTRKRTVGFYALLALDFVSLLTIIPVLTGLAFARLGRLLYASWRSVKLIDARARKARQAMYLVWIYPLVVPLAGAILYAVETQSPHPAVKTYFEACVMSIGFALTLGNDRPHTYAGNMVCGSLFVGGIICIGIISNSLSERYEIDDPTDTGT